MVAPRKSVAVTLLPKWTQGCRGMPVVPSALYSSAGVPSAPGVLPLFISIMAVLTSSSLGGRSGYLSRGF